MVITYLGKKGSKKYYHHKRGNTSEYFVQTNNKMYNVKKSTVKRVLG